MWPACWDFATTTTLGLALVLPTWPRRRPPGNRTLSTYAHSSDWGLRSGHASQERAGGGPPGLPRGRVWQAGLRRALPPSAAGARARPMWGACTGGMVFGVVWTCFGTQAGDDFGRDGDRLSSMEPCWQSRTSGHVTPARPPLRWGPAAALHPPGDVTRGGGGPPGGPTLRPGKGPCHHGAGPPPADAAAGLRWRGPAGPAHSPRAGRRDTKSAENRAPLGKGANLILIRSSSSSSFIVHLFWKIGARK